MNVRAALLACCATALSMACSDPPDEDVPSGVADGDQDGQAGGDGAGGDGAVNGDGGGGGGDGGSGEVGCLDAAGRDDPATASLTSGSYQASVTTSGSGCARTYVLSTTARLRPSSRTDGPRIPDNPRTLTDGASSVRTRNAFFDALYALALEEARENSVASISDFSFDPVDCPEGGCFQTGRDWTYVWTRDTAYSVDLGLAPIDPRRAMNSLAFKLSDRRGGGGSEVVQDTGSGGSYPISSDRVVWAMGARTLLPFLGDADRTAFAGSAFEALVNTAERDREIVYDATDGLYRGEQSFLDWRQQTYPGWTGQDVVHIGMSKALSTNVAHLAALETIAELAAERGDESARARYAGWADALRAAIARAFWLPDAEQFSSFLTTMLDPSPVQRFDALGVALAVLYGVGDESQRERAIQNYPHLPHGVPVIWPQQPDTPIYHNRSIWPFVSAYWLRAARAVGNDEAVVHGVASLMRGAALNLSNMENFELATFEPYLADGTNSGPVVNSQRQLWSVAGYLAMVHHVLFGIEPTLDGLRVAPFVPRTLRRELFGAADELVLNRFPFRDKTVSIRLTLPSAADGTGAYDLGTMRLNGQPWDGQLLRYDDLRGENLLEIALVEPTSPRQRTIRRMEDVANGRAVFGPRTPSVTNALAQGGKVAIDIDLGGALAANVTINVLRDGVRIAEGLAGSTTRYVDSQADATGATRCYSLELCDVATGTCSQHAAPFCYWGTGRIDTLETSALTSTGGSRVTLGGRATISDWGRPGDAITATYTARHTGRHLLQLVHSNGSGDVTTGVTCGVKRISVREGNTLVGSGVVLMPHTNGWDSFRDSSFVPVDLISGRSYTFRIEGDESTVNMSRFAHFERYHGSGGKAGASEVVAIAQLKVLSLAP